jgi:hypothetical protein
MRIDVNRDRNVANPSPGRGFDRGADGIHHGAAFVPLQQELTAVAAAEPESRRRPQERGARREAGLECRGQRRGGGLRSVTVGRREFDSHEACEGRVAKRAAALDLPGEESGGVVARGVRDGGRVGGQGLA